jgi:hypothetical protein
MTGTDSKGELMTSACISKMAPPLKSMREQHSDGSQKLPG